VIIGVWFIPESKLIARCGSPQSPRCDAFGKTAEHLALQPKMMKTYSQPHRRQALNEAAAALEPS
jgi:hypothetical protein